MAKPSMAIGAAMLGAGGVIVANTGYNFAGNGNLLWDPQFGGQPIVLLALGDLELTLTQLIQFIVGIVLIFMGLALIG